MNRFAGDVTMPVSKMTTLKHISELLDAQLFGDGSTEISHISIDSRTIPNSPNTVFFAIPGTNHDGHSYIAQLMQQGVKNFIVQNAGFITPKASFLLVKDTVKALQDLASYKRKTYQGQVIGITGSNGKTTVKEWLWACLSENQKVYRSPKSFNSQVGVPLSVWGIDGTAQTAIIEAGISMPGEMQKLQPIIEPEIGIFTGLGDAHQAHFESLEQKLKEKAKLFTHCHTLIYNMDNPLVTEVLTKQFPDARHVTCSVGNAAADLVFSQAQLMESKTILTYNIPKSKHLTMELPFTDNASIQNIMLIATTLHHFGFEANFIEQRIKKLLPVAMRLEQRQGQNQCILINDTYNSDLTSVKIALDFLNHHKQHQNSAVILSDIEQSAINQETLYGQVAELVNNCGANKFIGIGPELSARHSWFPKDSQFFPDVRQFLNQYALNPFRETTILIKGARNFGFEKIINALELKQHRTVLEINFNAIIHNLNHFRSLLKPGTKIMVMVKALAYGSGASEIALLLQHQQVDYLGVAFTNEGIELRNAGVYLPIMVMNPAAEDFETLAQYRLEPEIYSISMLEKWQKFITRNGLSDYPVHLKLDTGMHRLGFSITEINNIKETLSQHPEIQVKSIFSHLASADNPAHDAFTQTQVNRFTTAVHDITATTNTQPLLHILNSAGIERFPQHQFNMVRLGIGLYGASVKNDTLQDISRLKTRITQIRNLPANEPVGYGQQGQTKKTTTIAVLPVGYADGINRKLGNGYGQFVLHKKLVPTIGNICMDMCMVDITGLAASENDEVIIFGPENPISTLAIKLETIPYEILTSISPRVKKVYYYE